MSLSRSGALLRHELRTWKQDSTWIQLILFPLLFMLFLRGVTRSALVAEGYAGANGSEQVVPGMTLMFAFFLCGQVAFSIFQEHGQGTWERLRASPASGAEIVFAKTLTPWLMVMIQQTALFGIGVLFLDLNIKGSPLALFVVGAAFGLPLLGVGVMFAAFCHRSQQVNLWSSTLAMVFAGLGGTFVPASALPEWVATIAVMTPTHWAMRGYRSVILDGGGIFDVLLPAAVLVVMATVLMAIGLRRFRFEETKVVTA